MKYKGSVDLNFSLSGKCALVTGGANGIGKAICVALAKKGANIVLVDLNESARDVARELESYGITVLTLIQKLSDKASVQIVVDQAIEYFGKIDILVNNAGTSCVASALDFPEEEWDRILNVNLKMPFLLSQAVGRHMVQNGYGKIINMASQAAIIALNDHLAYAASKAGIVSLTKNMALEWGPLGINVNAVSPTVTLTELAKLYWHGEIAENMIKQIPVRRMAHPEEVAAAVLFLASDASDMISGENMVIDGGYTIQ